MAMAPEPAKSASWPPAVIWAVRIAIIALAVYNLWDFLDWIPSLRLSEGIGNTFYAVQNTIFIFVINPLAALAGIVLAVMNRRLKLAALLAAVPQIHFWGGVVAFAIGVMIYGF
jgi:hypothetical protein